MSVDEYLRCADSDTPRCTTSPEPEDVLTGLCMSVERGQGKLHPQFDLVDSCSDYWSLTVFPTR